MSNQEKKDILFKAKFAIYRMFDECSFDHAVRESYADSFIYYFKKELNKNEKKQTKKHRKKD